MEITDVRIRSVKPEGKLRAFASITLDHCLAIHNLKVIEGEKGLFVAMPSRKTNKGEFKDVVHPTSSELRNDLERIVIGEYEKVLEEGGLDSVAPYEDEEAPSAPEPQIPPDLGMAAPTPAFPAPDPAPVQTPEAPKQEVRPEEPEEEAPKEESREEKKSGGFSFRSLMGGK